MIIAVTGGKGGVGKSTVSLNLARELEAVVVDGDLSTADLPRGTGPDLHDVLAGQADPIDAVEQFWTMHLLPCGRTLEGARAANLEAFEETVQKLEREFGRVVIDCPAGLARDVGTELQSADLAVLVTNPDPAALEDARRTREVAGNVRTPTGAVVLNKATDEQLAGKEEAIEAGLGAQVTAIPDHGTVRDAQRDWVPVRDAAPNSPVNERFAEIAERIEECETRIKHRAPA